MPVKQSVGTYEGVDIFLDPDTGRFYAVIDGERASATTLAALQKKIKSNKFDFQPFGALSHCYGPEPFHRVTVTSVSRNKQGNLYLVTSDRTRVSTARRITPEVLPEVDEIERLYAEEVQRHKTAVRDIGARARKLMERMEQVTAQKLAQPGSKTDV